MLLLSQFARLTFIMRSCKIMLYVADNQNKRHGNSEHAWTCKACGGQVCYMFSLWPLAPLSYLFSVIRLNVIDFKFNYNLFGGNMCSIIVVTSGLLKGYVQGVEDSKHYPLCSTFYSFSLLCLYRSQLIKCSLPSQSYCSFIVDAMDIFCIHYAFQVLEDIRLATHILLLSFVLTVEQIVICLSMTFGS